MHKYLTEFIGMFLFVTTIGLLVLAPGGVSKSIFVPLAIGSVLMILVYMGGHVSGGHYNPAVSFAVLLRGKLSAMDFVIYVLCQLAGAILASVTVCIIRVQTFGVAPPLGMGSFAVIIPALMVEFIFTFALCLVVLNVATAKKTEGNSFYGLAIGFTIVVAAYAGGSISGGAYNPAIGTGPNIVDAIWGNGSIAHVWLYWVGPMTGAALAALVFRFQEAGSAAA